MKPEEINKVIAEELGWEFECSHDVAGKAVPDRWIDPDGDRHFKDIPYPDFYHDLNACHEFESEVGKDSKQSQMYMDYLQEHAAMAGIHATAPQRCEAFLRTIGKWK